MRLLAEHAKDRGGLDAQIFFSDVPCRRYLPQCSCRRGNGFELVKLFLDHLWCCYAVLLMLHLEICFLSIDIEAISTSSTSTSAVCTFVMIHNVICLNIAIEASEFVHSFGATLLCMSVYSYVCLLRVGDSHVRIVYEHACCVKCVLSAEIYGLGM